MSSVDEEEILKMSMPSDKYRLVLRAFEKKFGLEVARIMMEFTPRGSILALRRRVDKVLSADSPAVASELCRVGTRVMSAGSLTGAISEGAVIEIQDMVSREVAPELQQVFKDFDLNRDDALDYAEFMQLSQAYVMHCPLVPSTPMSAVLGKLSDQLMRTIGADAMTRSVVTKTLADIQKKMFDPLEQDSEKLQAVYVKRFTEDADRLAKRMFEKLCDEIPDQVLLPDFQKHFLTTMRQTKEDLVGKEILELRRKGESIFKAALLDLMSEGMREEEAFLRAHQFMAQQQQGSTAHAHVDE